MTGKLKPAAPIPPVTTIEWTGLRTQRVDYEPGATIFAQGDPATSVMYVESGAVRLSVVSHAGKEAVVAALDVGHFFGEGCLASQTRRMATASAMGPSSVTVVDKQDMVRHLHDHPAFADRFLMHMLTQNIRIDEDLLRCRAFKRDLDAFRFQRRPELLQRRFHNRVHIVRLRVEL